jgi:hypothetical protein
LADYTIDMLESSIRKRQGAPQTNFLTIRGLIFLLRLVPFFLGILLFHTLVGLSPHGFEDFETLDFSAHRQRSSRMGGRRARAAPVVGSQPQARTDE